MLINVHEAKTNLSQLLARVEAGELITIARAGKPVARLIPYEQPKLKDIVGCMKGEFEYPDDFLDPDPEMERMFGYR